VIGAAGPGRRGLLAGVGVSLPLEVVRPQQAFLRPAGGFRRGPSDPGRPPERDLLQTGTRGDAVGSISYDRDARVDPDDYDESADTEFLMQARSRMQRRLPAYGRAVVWGGGSGLYT